MICREKFIDFSYYDVHKDGTVFSKTIGKETKIHLTANGYVMNGYLHKDGTIHKHYRHRVIWYYYNGEIPEDHEIDHINGDKTDNHLDNLRCVSRKENLNNPVTIEKMKTAVWGNEERNKKIKVSNTGKIVSDEQKAKQSLAMSGINHPFWNKKRPEHSEIMKRTSRDRLGRWMKNGGC